jgi:hypothetical protein
LLHLAAEAFLSIIFVPGGGDVSKVFKLSKEDRQTKVNLMSVDVAEC